MLKRLLKIVVIAMTYFPESVIIFVDGFFVILPEHELILITKLNRLVIVVVAGTAAEKEEQIKIHHTKRQDE